MNILITGCSSGLGYEIAKRHLSVGDKVYGISRSDCDLDLEDFLRVDFKHPETYNKIRDESFMQGVNFNRVYLNAGQIGGIKPVNSLTKLDIMEIINGSVLGNKEVLDNILQKGSVETVIWTSSGAAEKAYDGLSLYCLSKAMNLQLARCYKEEFEDLEVYCINPGPFKSKMQEEIRSYDIELFSSLKRFNEKAEFFPTAEVVSKKILEVLSKNNKLPFNITLKYV